MTSYTHEGNIRKMSVWNVFKHVGNRHGATRRVQAAMLQGWTHISCFKHELSALNENLATLLCKFSSATYITQLVFILSPPVSLFQLCMWRQKLSNAQAIHQI